MAKVDMHVYRNSNPYRQNDPTTGINFEPGVPTLSPASKWLPNQPHIMQLNDDDPLSVAAFAQAAADDAAEAAKKEVEDTAKNKPGAPNLKGGK